MGQVKVAVDTNVLIYLYDQSSISKRTTAEKIVAESPFISTQVISEFLNTSRRLLPIPKIEIMRKCYALASNCQISQVNHKTLDIAIGLLEKYDFQLFDSIIVASALQEGCSVLYTEDMQNNLLVEESLRLVNPFSK